MTLNDVIFIDNLPSLDLHGYDAKTAHMMINDFIKENHHLKNEIVVIIHGIGTGVIYKETCETLRKNKLVNDFKTYYYNNGCTIVEINIDNMTSKC